MNLQLGFPSLLGQDSPPLPSTLETWANSNPWSTALIVLMTVAIIALGGVVYRLKVPPTTSRQGDDDIRHLVAKSVLFSAIWGTVVVAGLAILVPTNAREVLSMLLPVFGTWVGTLLAYYFSKDNYESGARNSANLAKALTGMEQLRAIPVTQPGIMIPVAKIELPAAVIGKKVADYGTVLLKVLLSEMKQQRLPLIDPDLGAFAVVHKSLINDFLVKQGMANLETATLKQLIDDPDTGKIAKNSFVVVPNTATLADVKERMAEQSRQSGVTCEDAFITPPASSKVEGWITNDIINNNALAVTADGQTR